jgi:hypothetical protein
MSRFVRDPGHERKTARLVLMILGAGHIGVSVGTGASFGMDDLRCHPPSCIEGGLGVALASDSSESGKRRAQRALSCA